MINATVTNAVKYQYLFGSRRIGIPRFRRECQVGICRRYL